jgi:signal transduction histidine kinase
VGWEKNAFISNISHEIRTPMNAIMGFAQMLQNTELTDKQSDYVEVIIDSGKKLLLLINNLLDLSNLQLGKTNINPVVCDLNAMIDKIWGHFRPLIASKRIVPTLEKETLLPTIVVDSEKIERVLSFILSNAIKFTPSGTITLKVSAKDVNEGIVVALDIIDTGIGIEEDKIPYIFDVFEQADNSITRPFPGIGLGLSLSKQIIKLLGGRISVQSKSNCGSHFHLEIPAKKG